MDSYGVMVCKPLFEVFPSKHPCHGQPCLEFNEFPRCHLSKPLAVKHYSCFVLIKNFKYLNLVCFGIFQNIIFCQRLSYLGPACGIPYHSGKIADKKNHFMSQVLKLAHLLKQDGVSRMNARGS